MSATKNSSRQMIRVRSRQPLGDGLERLRALRSGAQLRVHAAHEAIEVNALAA